MRLLHVGSGFRPWRRGGLVAYAEDLMAEQRRRGDEVAYFFSGRQYPLARGPRPRRWEHRGVAMLEVLDSPLYDHGRQPDLELHEPAVEALFAGALREVRPDVVHVQELAGLPSSILDVAREAGVPTVLTLQDYFAVCPAFKLLDAAGQVCLRREVGADCVATTAADPREPGLLVDATVALHLRSVPERVREPVARRLGRVEARRRGRSAPPPTAAAFQRRREVNVERLNRVDRVIAMSHRVAELHEMLGVDAPRLRTIHLTLAHIERLSPRRVAAEPPVTFGSLAGLESEAKGALLLIEAMRMLAGDVGAGRLRLVVFGHVEPRLRELAAGVDGIEVRGRYGAGGLDRVLDEVDVGLMTSVWEEAYGYAGVELLAKGIPVIANAIGGMVDYVRDGETGWLNRSLGAAELAGIMHGIAADPGQVARMSERVLAARDTLVKPLARHAAEIDAVYAELTGGS